jgi:hypothetical protein
MQPVTTRIAGAERISGRDAMERFAGKTAIMTDRIPNVIRGRL